MTSRTWWRIGDYPARTCPIAGGIWIGALVAGWDVLAWIAGLTAAAAVLATAGCVAVANRAGRVESRRRGWQARAAWVRERRYAAPTMRRK